MAFPSFRGTSLNPVADRQTLLFVFGIGVVSLLSVVGPGPELPIGSPLLVGLAVHGGGSRETVIERLTADVEALAASIDDERSPTDTEADRAARIRNDGVSVDPERNDDLGRLADAVDAMATAVEKRERRLAERERRSETPSARLEALFERSPDMIDVLDTDGTIVDVNQRFCDELGYTEDDLLGTKIWKHDELFDAADVRALLESVSVDSRRKFEGQYRRRDGSTLPVEIHLIRADLGDEDRFLVISRDITDRKEREQTLRERERQLTTLMSNLPGMVYRCRTGRDCSFEFVSDGCRELTGYEADELIGDDVDWFSDVVLEGHDDRWEIVRDAVSQRELFHTTFPIETADGERRWVIERGRGIFDDDGSLEAIEGVITDVTERVENERELERTTRLLEQSQQLATVGAWELDVREESHDLKWSEEVARIYGLEPDPDVGLSEAIEFYHPDDRDELRSAVDRAIEPGEPYDLELRIVPADGDDERWVRAIGEPVREDGEVVRLRGSIQDITDRKRRERDLRETKRRLELALEGTNTGIWELDLETGDLEWSETLERIVGLEPGAFGGTYGVFRQRIHPDDLERIERELQRAIENDELYQHGFRMRHENGEWIWVGARGRLVTGEDGRQRMVGINNDITERKQRERELERYETIIQAIGDPVYTLDASGTFQFVNDAMEPLAGYEPTELIGTDVSDLLPPDELELARELVRDLLREGTPYEAFEGDIITADGDTIETETHVALLPMDDGEFTGTAGVIRDITERKERERELERSTDLLERVQRMAKVGGWELDISATPPEATWTEELYRLHGLSRDVTPTLETTIDCYHPDDRPRVRDQLETAIETETDYALEARLDTDADDTTWVRAMGEPIHDDDGDLRTYRGSVQDITDQKRRELALESLHETARGLLNAETTPAVAELVVETAAELLESGSASVYLLDGETNRFESVASTPEFEVRSTGSPSVAVGDDDSVLWNTYVTGTQTVVDDTDIDGRAPLFGDEISGGLLVPIGNHGVFVLLAPPSTIDDETRQFVETLVATTEAAFDRLESEATLLDRDAELEAQNSRLRRQIQITEIIRGIDRSLIGADSRSEIERTVPERLLEAETVSFAWIGALDATGTTLEPRSWAGTEPEYLDTLSLDLEADAGEPALQTVRSETPTVVENVVDGLKREPWRRSALDAGFQSVVSVPIAFEEYGYGVLTVYADEPDAFGDLERTVFAELGEGIANAINAAKTQEALHAETLVELSLDLEAADDILSRIASATGADVVYQGLGTHSGAETVLFFETSGVPAADVEDVLETLVSVTGSRLVTESDGDCLFEATVSGDVVASRLVRHGASPRSIRATGTSIDITVDVPTTTDVREFVEMLEDHYDAVELRSRRHVQRTTHTRQELVTSLFDELTDRQFEVLRTAYLAGFFEWPRESTGEEIAAMLEVTQPTVNRHLRIGQQRLLEQLFEDEPLLLAEGV
ncbi:PAS domain S-box protein [Natronorubrum aibiense]|uniref:histidine kinase n=1 Tax=Natronorubrum aibiense TaxID=348826 RepID=A0A5P9P1N2_9EURY|nr:PAS domain S-box protein [Natronorubrum aibiense]QFU82034.1 PAS domain S-box protein [Natronorubrum aibiense]